MLRKTGLLTLLALSGCADVDFETACARDPSVCDDTGSADTATAETQESPSDTSTDVGSVDSATAEAESDTDVTLDTTVLDAEEASVDAADSALADAADSTTADAPDSTFDAADASDAKLDTASDAGADASICTANAYSCSGAILRQCNASGSAYTTIVTCPSAATCDPSLKRCTACTPGAYSCMGADRRVCDSFGANTTSVATCATPELCTSSSGATCKAPVCAVGDKRCGTKDVEVCNAGRTGWDTSKSCSISCSALTCLDVVEIAGARGGAGDHFCVRLSDGTVRCWGGGGPAVDGVGATATFLKPVPVVGIAGAVQIAVGEGNSGARFADGTVKLWGAQPDYSYAGPTVVAGLAGATTFALGAYFGCALAAGGAVKCWGANGAGQLGDGTTTDRVPPTFSATGLTGATGVACGPEIAFALFSPNSRGWGNPAEALGTGLTAGPVKSSVLSYSGVTEISGGAGFVCARQTDATVVCSGANDTGQLGNGTKTGSASAVLVSGLSNVSMVASGGNHTCALTTAGRVYCWGYNGAGQLGNGTKTDSAVPLAVTGITTAIQVASSSSTSCALLADRSVRCWGSNAKGQLGANLAEATTADSSAPLVVKF
jgi:hypothetical protein